MFHFNVKSINYKIVFTLYIKTEIKTTFIMLKFVIYSQQSF